MPGATVAVDVLPSAARFARLNAFIVKLPSGNLELLNHEVLKAIKSLLTLRALCFQEQLASTFGPEAEQLPDVLRIGGPTLTCDAESTWEPSRMLEQNDRGMQVDPVHILYKNTP